MGQLPETPVFRPLAEDVRPSGWLDERIGLLSRIEPWISQCKPTYRLIGTNPAFAIQSIDQLVSAE
jgi:hypothetical protein